MTEVSNMLRMLRTRRGVSQASLATRAGTSQSAVSGIERGRTDPSMETIERLALSLGYRTRLTFEEIETDIPVETLQRNSAIPPANRLRASFRSVRTLQRMRQAAQDTRPAGGGTP